MDKLATLKTEAISLPEGSDLDEGMVDHLKTDPDYDMEKQNIVAWMVGFPDAPKAQHFVSSLLSKFKNFRVLELAEGKGFIIEFYTVIVITLERIKAFRAQWEKVSKEFDGEFIGWKSAAIKKAVDKTEEVK